MPKQRNSPPIRTQLQKDIYRIENDPHYREMAKKAQKDADDRGYKKPKNKKIKKIDMMDMSPSERRMFDRST